MIYELRIYDTIPGRMQALHERFQNVTLKLFQKHGIRVTGFWEAVIGQTNRLYYMLQYESLAERERRWDAFMSDPEWQEARTASEKDGPIVAKIYNIILKPTKYSPMKWND